MGERRPGLTELLVEHYDRQITGQRAAEERRCPGELECLNSRGMPLFKRPDQDVITVCGKCERRFSKAGWLESDIRDRLGDWPEWLFYEVVLSGYHLHRLKECGAQFAYPDGLTRYEWMALESLAIARNDVDARESGKGRKSQQQPEMNRATSRAALLAVFGDPSAQQ